MNNPNPLIPQGSLLEQKAKGKPHLRVAYIIVAVHLVFLGGLLIQGCKKEDQPSARTGQPTNDTVLPPLDQANLYPTNPAPSPTNLQEVTTAPPGPIPTSPTLASPQPESVTAREYVVVRGDNFTTLGRKFGVTAPAIARANPGVNSTQLKVGQKLVIPAPASPTIATAMAGASGDNLYMVKTGDTLSKIATAHRTTVTEIKSLNSLKTDLIKTGDKLKLPAAKTAPTTGAPAAANPATPTSPTPGSAASI